MTGRPGAGMLQPLIETTVTAMEATPLATAFPLTLTPEEEARTGEQVKVSGALAMSAPSTLMVAWRAAGACNHGPPCGGFIRRGSAPPVPELS